MKCNIFIISVLFLFQEINSKSLPLTTESVCTLSEAAEINNEYVEIISSICDKATIVVNDNVNSIKDDLDQTEQELSRKFLKVLDNLEAEVNKAQEKAQENGWNQVLNCLTVLTARVNTVKDKYNYDSLSCLLDGQKEEAKMKTKQLTKIEKKIKSIENKAAQSLGKCSIKFGPLSFGSCSSLNMCCESVRDRLVEKIGLYTRKLDGKVSELLSENRECYQESFIDARNTANLIKLLIEECLALQTPSAAYADLDESNLSDEHNSNNEPENNQSDNYNNGDGEESNSTNDQDSQQQTKDQESDKPGLNSNERLGQEENPSQSGSEGPNGCNDRNGQKAGIQGTNKSEVSPNTKKPDQSGGNNGSNGNDDGQNGQKTHQPAVEQKPSQSGCNSINCQNDQQAYVQDINQSKVNPNEGVNKESNGNNSQDGHQIVSQDVNQPKTNPNEQLVGLSQGGSKGSNAQNGHQSKDSNQDVNSEQSQPNNQDDQQSNPNQGGEGFSQSKAEKPPQIDSSQFDARLKSQYEDLIIEQALVAVLGLSETFTNTPDAGQKTAEESNQIQAEQPAHSKHPLAGSTQPQLEQQSQAENVKVKQQESLEVAPSSLGQAKPGQQVKAESSGTEQIQTTAAKVSPNAGQTPNNQDNQQSNYNQGRESFSQSKAEKPPQIDSSQSEARLKSQYESLTIEQALVAALRPSEASINIPNAGQETAGESNQTQAERPAHSKYPPTGSTQPQLEQQSQAENVEVKQQGPTESLEVAPSKTSLGQAKAGQQVKAESSGSEQIQTSVLGQAEAARVNPNAGQTTAGESNQTVKNPQAERPAYSEHSHAASTQSQLEQQSQAEDVEVKHQEPAENLKVAPSKAIFGEAKAGQQVGTESLGTEHIQGTVLGQAEAARVNPNAGQTTSEDPNRAVKDLEAPSEYLLTASTQPQLKQKSQTENPKVKLLPTKSLEVASPADEAELQPQAGGSGSEQVQAGVLGRPKAETENPNAGQKPPRDPNQAVKDFQPEQFASSEYPPTASTQPLLELQTQTASLDAKHQAWSVSLEITPSVASDARQQTNQRTKTPPVKAEKSHQA